MSPSFLLPFGCALTGLLLGGAAAWFLPGGERKPALTDSAPRNGPAAGPEARPADKPALTNRRSRLLRLMEASARGGEPSLAQAWRDAAGDPAMRAWLAELWMKEDPAAFIRMFYASDGAFFMNAEGNMVGNLVTRFAEQNPQTALKVGATLQPLSAGRWITAQAIIKIMESDVAEGLALAAKHPELRLNGNMDLDRIKITSVDIPFLLSLPRAMMVDMMLAKAANTLPAAEAMRVTSQMSFTTKRSVATAVARRWVNEDPAAAEDFAINRATEQQRLRILESLGEKKVTDNPADGAAWAERNLAGLARNRVLDKAAQKLEKADPAAAEAIRARLPQHYNPKPQ